MNTYTIWLEPADTDEPKRIIGSLMAMTQADALDMAAQYYEYDSADLLATLVDPYYCGMCRAFRDISHFPHSGGVTLQQ